MAGGQPTSSGTGKAARPVAVQGVAKVCTSCGQDVAALPRVKDEAGRYWCKPCVAKEEARASQKAAGAGGGSDETRYGEDGGAGFDGIDLAAAAAVEARAEAIRLEVPKELRCPGCSGELDPSARICIKCGYDKERRGKVATQVHKAPKLKASREELANADNTAGKVLLGVGLVLVACGMFAPWAGDAGVPLSLALSVFTAATFITCVVFAFIDRQMLPALSGSFVILAPVVLGIVMLVFAFNLAGGGEGAAATPGGGRPGFGSAIGGLAVVILLFVLIIFGCISTLLYGMRQHRAWLGSMALCTAISIACSIAMGLLAVIGVVPKPGE